MTQHTWREILDDMADVGQRMWQIGAAEGSAGNMSVFMRDLDELDPRFPRGDELDLPVVVPALAAGWLAVSRSGRRIRDIGRAPGQSLCLLHIHAGGARATLHGPAGARPTSELNSHLAVHDDHVRRRELRYHAVLHAQPLRLTFLSHVDAYGDTQALNRRLLRWQPETIVEFPEGIGVLPFEMHGSPEQMAATVAGLREHRAVIWRCHGIVTRADASIGKAGDLVEYAEAAARYEYLNLQSGSPSTGLSDGELRLIAGRLGIDQHFF